MPFLDQCTKALRFSRQFAQLRLVLALSYYGDDPNAQQLATQQQAAGAMPTPARRSRRSYR